MNSFCRPLLLPGSLRASAFFVCISASVLLAAPDDFDEQPMPQPTNGIQFNMVNINVDQQIFQHHSSEETARAAIKESLQLQLEAIDLICHLDESQKAQLLLAAEGDMTRFFSTVSDLRQKYSQTQNDGNVWNEFWQKIQPLQLRYSQGLFQDNSLLEKTLRASLNEQQSKDYDAFVQERKKRIVRTRCELAVMEFERYLPLRGEQRKQLVDVLDQGRSKFANQEQFPQVFWILQLPAAKLRPIFDEWQWKKMEPQIRQFNPQPIINGNIFNLIPLVR